MTPDKERGSATPDATPDLRDPQARRAWYRMKLAVALRADPQLAQAFEGLKTTLTLANWTRPDGLTLPDYALKLSWLCTIKASRQDELKQVTRFLAEVDNKLGHKVWHGDIRWISRLRSTPTVRGNRLILVPESQDQNGL